MAHDQLEGRNPVIEALVRGRRKVRRIWLDKGAKPDARIQRILRLAESGGVPLARASRGQLDEMSEGRVHQGVIAHAAPLPEPSLRDLVDQIFDAPDPSGRGGGALFVLADQVQYEHNLGAILRSALGFGVTGVVLPTRRGAGLTSVVQRVSMGGAEAVPVVHEGLFAAMKPLKKAGVRIIGADMGGEPMTTLDMRGPVALVMGGEGKGLSPTLRKHCDSVVSIPLAGALESLNVSVAAALLMYEKRRQDGWYDAPVE